MASRFKVQDATGVIVDYEPIGKLIVYGTAAPTNAQAGFSKGCLYINVAGAAGSLFYVNQGTNLSTTWLNVA